MAEMNHLCTRCAAVIVEDGRLLLSGHYDGAGLFFWTFPGGVCREGETAEQCAIREAREETGLDVEVAGLLYHLEWALPVGCRNELYFLAHTVGGTLTGENDPHGKNHDDSPRPLLWVPAQDIAEFPFRPGEIRSRLPNDAARLFRGAPYAPICFED